MDMKETILKFRKEFEFQIDKKPSWGQKEIKDLFTITLNNVLLENTEYNKVNKINNNERL